MWSQPGKDTLQTRCPCTVGTETEELFVPQNVQSSRSSTQAQPMPASGSLTRELSYVH